MATRLGTGAIAIESLRVSAYKVPTDAPESGRTIAWDGTTLVLVEVDAGGRTGVGYSYTDASAATLFRDVLAKAVGGVGGGRPRPTRSTRTMIRSARPPTGSSGPASASSASGTPARGGSIAGSRRSGPGRATRPKTPSGVSADEIEVDPRVERREDLRPRLRPRRRGDGEPAPIRPR